LGVYADSVADVRQQFPALGGVPAGAVEAEHRRLLEDLHLRVLAGRVTVDDARVERFRQLLVFAGGTASAGMRRPRRPPTARRTSRTGGPWRGRSICSRTCTVACRRAS